MSDSTHTWRAGTASVKITPAEPMWLAGWAVRKEPARGVHSDLHATALVLEDLRGEKLVLVSVDLIAMPRGVCDRVATRLRERLNISRENFVFAATHTHCGPEIREDKVPFFGIPEEYAKKIAPFVHDLEQRVAGVIVEAADKLEPARLTVHSAQAEFAQNRRAAGGVLDHVVPVLKVASQDQCRAVVFGYACHNLTMPPEDLRYSSDFSGSAREQLESQFPGVKALFVTGCAADQNPEPRGQVELVDQHGQALARAVLGALATDGVGISSSVRAVMEDVTLEIQEVTAAWIEEGLSGTDAPRRTKAQYLKARLERGERLERTYDAPMQAIRLGNELLMIAMSGEPVAAWAQRFREQFHAPFVWPMGYCNDMFGYIPTREIQSQGGYEVGRANLWSALPAPWTDDVEDRVAACIGRLVTKLERGGNG